MKRRADQQRNDVESFSLCRRATQCIGLHQDMNGDGILRHDNAPADLRVHAGISPVPLHTG